MQTQCLLILVSPLSYLLSFRLVCFIQSKYRHRVGSERPGMEEGGKPSKDGEIEYSGILCYKRTQGETRIGGLSGGGYDRGGNLGGRTTAEGLLQKLYRNATAEAS